MVTTPEIKIKAGTIVGKYIEDNVVAYLGIPYAKPPVGELRLMPPVDHPEWDDVKDCTEFGSSPYQAAIGPDPIWTEEFKATNTNVSEDCLTINVFANPNKKNMPVVLYHYGGGFTSGGSSCEIYDGTELAKRGVVLVTFNHRVGTLALFTSKEDESSASNESNIIGNHLLLDDLQALKWVRENIAFLGGDSENITIMGQSSGASEVNMLTASALTKGKIKRSISLGFNSYNLFSRPLLTKEFGRSISEDVLKQLNVSEDELKNVDAKSILDAGNIGNLITDGYIIKKQFKDAVNEGDTNQVPFVMSAVPGDCLMGGIFSRYMLDGGKVDSKDILKQLCSNFFQEKEEEAERIYDFDNREIDDIKRDINNDFLVAAMLEFAIGRKEASCEQPTYILFFTHVMPGPMADKFGAFHSCEVPYFFNHLSDYRKEYWKEEDYSLGERMVSELAAFVSTGEFASEEFVPSDGTNYTLIQADGIQNVTFPKEKLDIYLYALSRVHGEFVRNGNIIGFREDAYKK